MSSEEMETNGELPEGWASSPLQNLIIHVLGGDWGKSPDECPKEWINVRVIRGTEFRDWEKNKGSTSAHRCVKPTTFEQRRLREGDLVIEISGGGPDQPVGRTLLVDDESLANSDFPLICSNFCRHVRVSNELESKYIQKCLQEMYYRGEFDRFQNQTVNIRNLQFPEFSAETILPIAPLEEQKRIVAQVEKLLARVSDSRERLDRVPGILKRFRQSILAAACSGQLTADWRDEQHDSNDSANPKRNAHKSNGQLTKKCTSPKTRTPPNMDLVSSDCELPAIWKWKSPDELCSSIVDCPHSTPKWTNEGNICLRTTNFQPGSLELAEVRYVSSETFKLRNARLTPLPGDVVYSREGGILGIACMIPEGAKVCLGQRMMLMRTDPSICLPTYFMNVLNSPSILAIVREMTGGTSSPHLNVGDIKTFPIPLPHISEQHEIVRRVEALFKLADSIESRFEAGRARANALTQSILRSAFRGELVPTEAELARAEGRDYEPASTLLVRIQAERNGQAAPTTKAPKKKGTRNATRSK